MTKSDIDLDGPTTQFWVILTNQALAMPSHDCVDGTGKTFQAASSI